MAGVHNNTFLASVLAEKDSLVSSFAAELPGGKHATTVAALRDFMNRFGGGEGSIPWVRMYESLPPRQQRCGLLQENWDRNVVPERAKVIFTLITPLGQGRTFSREALGGGKWNSKGAEAIGNRVVLTKLYFNGGGFTAFEFHLANDQPRVALWILHQKDYRHCVRDLRQYIQQGRFPGQIQGNLQVMQDVLPNYQDSSVAGSMNGPHVEHTTIPVSNSGISCSMPSIHSSASMDGDLNQLGDLKNNSMLQSTEDFPMWEWDDLLYSNCIFTQDGL